MLRRTPTAALREDQMRVVSRYLVASAVEVCHRLTCTLEQARVFEDEVIECSTLVVEECVAASLLVGPPLHRRPVSDRCDSVSAISTQM
jgi:hypothetical protein